MFLRCIFAISHLLFYVHLLDYLLPTLQPVPLPVVVSRSPLSHLIIITWSAFRSLILVKRSNRSRKERKLNCFHIRFAFPYPFLSQHTHVCVYVYYLVTVQGQQRRNYLMIYFPIVGMNKRLNIWYVGAYWQTRWFNKDKLASLIFIFREIDSSLFIFFACNQLERKACTNSLFLWIPFLPSRFPNKCHINLKNSMKILFSWEKKTTSIWLQYYVLYNSLSFSSFYFSKIILPVYEFNSFYYRDLYSFTITPCAVPFVLWSSCHKSHIRTIYTCFFLPIFDVSYIFDR